MDSGHNWLTAQAFADFAVWPSQDRPVYRPVYDVHGQRQRGWNMFRQAIVSIV